MLKDGYAQNIKGSRDMAARLKQWGSQVFRPDIANQIINKFSAKQLT